LTKLGRHVRELLRANDLVPSLVDPLSLIFLLRLGSCLFTFFWLGCPGLGDFDVFTVESTAKEDSFLLCFGVTVFGAFLFCGFLFSLFSVKTCLCLDFVDVRVIEGLVRVLILQAEPG